MLIWKNDLREFVLYYAIDAKEMKKEELTLLFSPKAHVILKVWAFFPSCLHLGSAFFWEWEWSSVYPIQIQMF